MPTHL